jgi:hypothetical protein
MAVSFGSCADDGGPQMSEGFTDLIKVQRDEQLEQVLDVLTEFTGGLCQDMLARIHERLSQRCGLMPVVLRMHQQPTKPSFGNYESNQSMKLIVARHALLLNVC